MKILKKLVVLSAVAVIGQVDGAATAVEGGIRRLGPQGQNLAQAITKIRNVDSVAGKIARAAAEESSVAGRLLRAKNQAEDYLMAPDVQERLRLAGSMAAGGAGLAAAGGALGYAMEIASRPSVESNRYDAEEGGVIYNWLKNTNDGAVTPLSYEEIKDIRAANQVAVAPQVVEDIVGLEFAKQELAQAGLNLEAAKNSGASLSRLRDLQDDVRAAEINVLGQEQALTNDAFDYQNAENLINTRNARMTAAKDYGNAVGYKAKYGFDRAKDWTSAMSNNAYDAAAQRFGRAKSWTMSAPRNAYDSTRQGLSNGTSWLRQVPTRVKDGATSAWERFTSLFARNKQQAAQ